MRVAFRSCAGAVVNRVGSDVMQPIVLPMIGGGVDFVHSHFTGYTAHLPDDERV